MGGAIAMSFANKIFAGRAGPGRASMIFCGPGRVRAWNLQARPGRVLFFPINAPGMGRFQLLNLGVLGYGLELKFWVVIAIIVSLTQTITLITTLTGPGW